MKLHEVVQFAIPEHFENTESELVLVRVEMKRSQVRSQHKDVMHTR